MKLELGNAKSYVKDTFRDMDTRSRVTQAIRLFSAFLSILLTIVLLVGSYRNPNNFFLVKLNTSTIDVSKGLFSALQNDFSSNELLNDKFGAGLTSSEVLILAEYAEEQVKDAPDVIKSSLYSWCYTSFNYKINGDYLTSDDYTFKISNASTTCSKPVSSYFFDYRSLMSQAHFEIILEYAYGDTGTNRKYLDYLNRRVKIAHAAPNLLVFTAASQFVLLFLLGTYYRFKNSGTDIPKLLAHISSVLSLVSFITCAVACISLTVIYLQFRGDIHSELSAYGFSLHMGVTFFTIMWIIFCMVLLSMTSWGGPTWCAPPSPIQIDDDDSQMEMFLHRTQFRSEDDAELETDSKPKKSLFKRQNHAKGNVVTTELDSEERTPSPDNYLTNEEEVLLKSNDKIFRSGTFRY